MSLDEHFFPKCTKDEVNQFALYVEILENKLQPAGLIGPGDRNLIWKRHIQDSLLPLLNPGLSIIIEKAKIVSDLGAGAGLPGIPLAIKYPNTQFQLVDGSIKRVEMLRELVDHLGLKNVNTICSSLGSDKFNGKKADVILFRAFRKPLAALELALYASTIPSSILYWRIQNPFINPSAFSRIGDLGIKLMDKLIWEGFDQPSGIYYFSRTKLAAKGFPRAFGKIQKDPLVESVV